MRKSLIAVLTSLALVFAGSISPAQAAGPDGCSLTGDGTSGNPFLVDNTSDLLQTGINACGGDGVYFLQTNDIYVPTDWAGNLDFVGSYDGDGYELSYDAATDVSKNNYGIWANIGDVSSESMTEVKNLNIWGSLTTFNGSNNFDHVGLLGGSAHYALFDHIFPTGSISAPNATSYLGGLVGYTENSTISYVTSRVNISGNSGDTWHVGGISGHDEFGSIHDSKWVGEISFSDHAKFVGGIVGDCFDSTFHDNKVGTSSSSSSIYVDSGEAVGGLTGSLFGLNLGGSTTGGQIFHNEVFVTLNVPSTTKVGSLAGAVTGFGSSTGDSAIYENYATGAITTDGDNIGGLIGWLDGDGDNPYVHDNASMGSISAGAGTGYVGALFGAGQNTPIEHNYSLVTLTGDLTNSSGVVGNSNLGTYGSIWSETISGNVSNPAGVNVGQGEMTLTSTYRGYNFSVSDPYQPSTSSVWIRCNRVNDGYPFLRHFNNGYGCLIDQNVPTPTISGSPDVGNVLTGDPGTWDALTSQTYEWLRDGSPILDSSSTPETGLTYTVTSSDLGHAITFHVISSGVDADKRDADATSAAANVAAPTCSLSGSGTANDPFLVGSVSDLLQTGTNLCGGDGVYFLQTDDIYVPSDWAGDLTFVGIYDGDNHDLRFDTYTDVTHESFGIWAFVGNTNSENTTVVKNVYAGGSLRASHSGVGFSNVGLLAGNAANATFDHVSVDGSIAIPSYASNLGGLIGSSTLSTFSYVTASVQITASNDASELGGISGLSDTCEYNNSSWDGGLVVMGSGNEIGGITGLSFGTVFHDNRVGMNSETGIIVHGGSYVGGISGVLLGQINYTSNVYHNEVVVGISGYDAQYLGLLVGSAIDNAEEGSALNIYENIAYGYLSDSGNAFGGLIGNIDGDTGSGASVHDNEALGYIYAMEGATNVGALVGTVVGATIRHNYTRVALAGDLSGSQGIAGYIVGYTAFYENVWSDTISGQVASPLGINVGEGDMQLTATYSDHGFDISDTSNLQNSSVWIRCNRVNDGYPVLRHFNSGYGCLIDQNVPTPTLSGDTPIGSVLTGDPGNWDLLTTQTYQWLRDGSPISGQTGLTYTTTADDAGHDITFEVTSNGLPADEHDATATTSAITVDAASSGGGNNNGGGSNNGGGGNSGGGSTPTAFLTKSVGGFTDNSWLLTKSIRSGLKSLNRQAANATSALCVGIVVKSGTSAWQKKVGLARARNACNYLKALNPEITFTVAYKTSKQNAKIRRGVSVTFSR